MSAISLGRSYLCAATVKIRDATAAPRKRKAPVMCRNSSHSYLPKAAATLLEPADGKIDLWRRLSGIFSS